MSSRILVISTEQIAPHIQIRDCIPLVEEAFRAKAEGKADLPVKYHDRNVFGLWFFMGGNVRTLEATGIKVGCATAGRASAQVIYYDHTTAAPLALMEGLYVTELRTGAAAAVGAKYLARPESETVGIIGTGSIGWSSLAALQHCFSPEKVHAYDMDPAAQQAFVTKARDHYPFEVIVASAEETVQVSDILVTATPSRQPIVKAAWVGEGTHISAMGADSQGKQELESTLHVRARIICDSMEQCVQWGDVNNTIRSGLLDESSLSGTLGEVILGRKQGRATAEEITIFDATGMGIQDAAVAKLVYETALERGVGTWAEL